MPCLDCIAKDIPEKLCSENKSTDIPIENTESLYRRTSEKIEGNIIDLDLKIVERIFRLNNDSYNRSKFSDPEDVLIDNKGVKYPNEGIIELKIKHLEKDTLFRYDNDTKVCTFRPIFVPEECNYSHSEIWCYINGERRELKGPPKTGKAHFRRQILKSMSLLKQAN